MTADAITTPVVIRACRKKFFIISVDAIFTTLFEWLFTNVFDVIARIRAISCVYRARNAD
jgi:hypothetical protein